VSAHWHTHAFFAGVFAILLIVTVISRLWALCYAADGSNPAVSNLNARIGGWWMIGAVSGLAFALGKAGVILLFGLLSFAALREFFTLARLTRSDHSALLMVFFVAVPLQYYLIWIEWYGLYSILIPVYAFALLPVFSALRGEPRTFLDRAAEIQTGLMIAVYCVSHVPALATLRITGYEGRELQLVLFFLLVVQASDVFQYAWGKLLGKTPVAPKLSPAKTVEGCVLGIASATLLGAAFSSMTPFEPWQAAILSLLATAMGFLGGLIMSAIKRDRGTKDWGWLIPGHGGILDRLDSVVFAAPVFFHLTRYWWAD
jgi:phosphatidate cytidylyltransferase